MVYPTGKIHLSVEILNSTTPTNENSHYGLLVFGGKKSEVVNNIKCELPNFFILGSVYNCEEIYKNILSNYYK